MPIQMIVPNLYQVSLGFVNVFLIDTGDGLALIDAGTAGSEKRILAGISELGKQPSDLRAILITHLHEDHVGGLPAVYRASGAPVYMHTLEADAYVHGSTMRTIEPAPGLLNALLVKSIRNVKPSPNRDIAPIQYELKGGEEIEAAGGIRAIHTPGHTAGHLVFLWPRDGGVLITGDIASHMLRLGYSFLYENFQQGRQTLCEVARLPFEKACFSHGKPITQNAAQAFDRAFTS